jgi:hypothetical protein
MHKKRQHIETWRESESSQAGYCRQQNLLPKTLSAEAALNRITQRGNILETGKDSYRITQRKQAIKINSPTLQPGKFSTMMGVNFWMVIDIAKFLK